MIYVWADGDSRAFNSVIRQHFLQQNQEFQQISKLDRLAQMKEGDVGLICGKPAMEWLQAGGVIQKNKSLNKTRGIPLKNPIGGGRLLVCYAPGMVNYDYARKADILWDVQLATRLHNTGVVEPNVGKYRYVQDFSDVIARAKELYEGTGKPVPVATDLETMGLVPHDKSKRVVSISITVEEGMADVYYFNENHDQPAMPQYGKDLVVTGHKVRNQKLYKQLKWLMTSKTITHSGANLKFDEGWTIEKWGLRFSNFKFDTTLVGSILDENRSNSLNMHAKTYTEMGGYDDCVSPDTLLCTDDLRWVPAGEIKPGDSLLGFDEDCPPHRRRKLRRTHAVSTKRLMKAGVVVTLSNGVSIECSADHGFLAHKYQNNGPFQWVHAQELRAGCRIQTAIDPEVVLDGWDSGYISGLYDGEGYISSGGLGIQSGLSQKPGPVWGLYEKIMTDVGLGGYYANARNTDGVMTSKHAGADTLRVLQMFRPIRLLNKYAYDGKCIPSGTTKVYVESVKHIGDIEVVSLETGCHTFVAEGLCSHNSFNSTHDKAHMENVPKEDLLGYAGGDTDACLRVRTKMKSQLMKDKKLTRFYTKVLHPASKVFSKLEQRGMLVDIDEYEVLKTKVEAEIERLEAKLFGMMPRRIKLKFADNLTLRAAVLKEFLFTPRGLNLTPQMYTAKAKEETWQYASTSMDHFEMFDDVPEAQEFVDTMREYNSATKTLSTYIVGFMKHIRQDGRFHPSYMLYKGDYGGDDAGTVTGRLSAKDPAFQCLRGDQRVLTHRGWVEIKDIVSGYESGESYQVLTHTGEWKPVIGTYRNGVQPVFDVRFATGKIVTSTANHPYLTARGWVRTDGLTSEDIGYEFRAPDEELHQSDIPQLGGNEEQVQQPNEQGLSEVRGSGHNSLRPLAMLRPVFGGHGGEASEGLVHREAGRERQLRAGQLCVGYAETAGQQSEKHQADRVERADQDGSRVGFRSGDQSGAVALSAVSGDGDGGSLGEKAPRDRGLFKSVKVRDITPSGECETFDLTIEGSHSFIAEGIIVHNTIPKHTIWAKPLRRVYIAPPGMVVLNVDFSQGELRVAACVANEPTMIQAYQSGIDMHLRTGLALYNLQNPDEQLTMGEALELKKHGDSRVKVARQGGKAGNFGLIYGMQAPGFQSYAKKTYHVDMTMDQSYTFRENFFDMYPVLPDWHEEYVNMAHDYGYVRSPLGRIRHLPLIQSSDWGVRSKQERQAINSPIQATLSDMALMTMIEVDRQYPDLHMFG